MLHVASQGDQPLPLVYFVDLGMDINIADNKLSTPLHWACFARSEVALNYILSMNPNLEAKDQQGFTALHLAVKSVEQLQSTRPVRSLLLKGSQRLARDNNGNTPADVIPESLSSDLRNELKQMLVI